MPPKKVRFCLQLGNPERFFFLKKRARAGFSLVELVAVMAVMAVVLTMAAVNYSSSPERSARVARDLVVAQVTRARSHAIATGIPTALVLSPYHTGPSATRGRMMGLVEVKKSSDAAVGFEADRVLTRWRELPKGQLFVPQSLAQRSQATVLDSEKKLTLSLNGELIAVPYLLFSREGRVLYPPTAKIEICLAPAIVDNGNPRLTGVNQDGSSVEVIEVSRLSGRARLKKFAVP